MKYKRVRFTVEVNLDPVPGWNHGEQDFADHTRRALESTVPWYRPIVSAATVIEDPQP